MRIGELARRAGVSPATVRAWERRYGLLTPRRTHGAHRVYSEADLEQLRTVRALVTNGLRVAAAVEAVRAGTAIPPQLPDRLFRRVVDNSPAGVWIVDRSDATRFVNGPMAEMLGITVEEAFARSLFDFVDPDLVPAVQTTMRRLREGRPVTWEATIRRADGSPLTAAASATALFDEDGAYDGAAAILVDVTARREAERQAAMRAQLVDAVGQAVIATTLDGTIVHWNPAATRIYGWSAEEALGRSLVEMALPHADIDAAQDTMAELAAGRSWSGQFDVRHRDGHLFTVEVTATALRDDTGQVIGFVGVSSDISERKAAERALELRAAQQETVALLGVRALSGIDTDTLVSEAVESLLRVVAVDAASILELRRQTGDFVLRAGDPTEPPIPGGLSSLAGYTARSGQAVIVDNVASERRFDPGPRLRARGTVSALAAPLLGLGSVLGVLVVESDTPRSFSHDDRHFVQSVANVLAAALERERIETELEQLTSHG